MKLRLLLLAGFILVSGCIGIYAAYAAAERTPGELLRYTERRLIGHPNLELVFKPIIHWTRRQVERPVPPLGSAVEWRGASAEFVGYAPAGENGGVATSMRTDARDASRRKMVGSVSDLLQAVRSARPGDVIEILPGKYRVTGRSIPTPSAGLPAAPITVRAGQLGRVVLEFDMLEGFHVQQPHWTFENLEIVGVCSNDSDCEHAFHIVGAARSTVIRNNRVRDFNAHIKVNGVSRAYPDAGIVQSNTLYNTRARKTANPVTPIDIVAANEWLILDNLIYDFVKLDGNQVSYGAFIKGGGARGRFERNLVICALALHNQPGVRVGLSFGGGGTGTEFCRGGGCEFEHEQGYAVNNIVAHCNDSGIDVNRSKHITIAHNTVINTAGIDVRNHPASAAVSNNVVEGRIRERGGGWTVVANNWEGSARRLFVDRDRLELAFAERPETVPALAAVTHDICGELRASRTLPGAIGGDGACLRKRADRP
jgi:hypothetical protein